MRRSHLKTRIRSSPAAEKAINDGDLLECHTSSSIVDARSTRSKASQSSSLLFQKPAEITSMLSTRTCRKHVADGKSLLQKQKAEVWNRPSTARPERMWWQGIQDDETSLDSNATIFRQISSLTDPDFDGYDFNDITCNAYSQNYVMQHPTDSRDANEIIQFTNSEVNGKSFLENHKRQDSYFMHD
jgi:hypothetical protein